MPLFMAPARGVYRWRSGRNLRPIWLKGENYPLVPQTPLEELTALPQIPSLYIGGLATSKGIGGEGKGRKEGGEGREEQEGGSWRGEGKGELRPPPWGDRRPWRLPNVSTGPS